MIKFFRKIRQNFLAEGKTGKYIKYAIGEIILVMIGILLALQVNNWNESRKKRITEIEILSNIREGLSTDLNETIAQNIHLTEERDSFTKIIVMAAISGNEVPDSLNHIYGTLGYPIDFHPVTAPYEILQSKGLDLISNKELKFSIINLYNLKYQKIRDLFLNETNVQRDLYRPHLNEHLTFYPARNFQYLPLDYQEMIQDQEFIDVMITMNFTTRRLNNNLKALEKEVLEIINKIDNKLDSGQ